MRLLLVLVLAVAGCSGDDDVGPGDGDGDGDGDGNDVRTSYLVDRLVLPTSPTELNETKFSFPGMETPANKLGGVLQVMLDLLEGLPVQQMIDDNLAAGAAAQAIVFETDGPITGSDDRAFGAWVRAADADSDELSPTWTVLTVELGLIRGVGADTVEAVVEVPVNAEMPVRVRGVYQQIRGTADEAQFSGAIAGAITPETLSNEIIPPSAELLNQAVIMGLPNAQQILDLLDGDGDGRISADDLRSSVLLTTLTAPDVDLDGDGVGDHISLGVMVTATRRP